MRVQYDKCPNCGNLKKIIPSSVAPSLVVLKNWGSLGTSSRVVHCSTSDWESAVAAVRQPAGSHSLAGHPCLIINMMHNSGEKMWKYCGIISTLY